jgi:hypothetical protein
MLPINSIVVFFALGFSSPLGAQVHDHRSQPQAGIPTEAGQAAFAAIREIVAILEADSTTDWTKVDLEALRRHLITMDRVLMESQVVSRPIPGGIELDVTGPDPVSAAITEMVGAHAGVLDRDPMLRGAAGPIAGGVRLRVTAEDPANARLVGRIRGLGFAGLLATGEHHSVHHLAIARGQGGSAHQH